MFNKAPRLPSLNYIPSAHQLLYRKSQDDMHATVLATSVLCNNCPQLVSASVNGLAIPRQQSICQSASEWLLFLFPYTLKVQCLPHAILSGEGIQVWPARCYPIHRTQYRTQNNEIVPLNIYILVVAMSISDKKCFTRGI